MSRERDLPAAIELTLIDGSRRPPKAFHYERTDFHPDRQLNVEGAEIDDLESNVVIETGVDLGRL